MKRKPKPKLPIQFEDVAKASWALQGALGNNYGSASASANDDVIQWSGDPRRAARDFVAKVQTLRRALESARKVVDTIGETRAKGAALPDMVGNIELKQRLNALVGSHGGWGAPGEPLPAAGLGSVKASIMREARKLRYEWGDATIDRQAWRIDRLERIADNWTRTARLDGLNGGETEGGVSLAPVFQAGGETWAEAAATARRDEGEGDADVASKHARAKAEREASAKAFRESYEHEQAEREAEYARKRAEAEADMTRVEEAIRSGNAALKSVRDGSKRKYLINVASAKGERDPQGYFKRETFAIEGRVWWPLGVSRYAEDDGKGGHQASKKRKWSVSFLPVGQKVGSAFSVKEAEDMAKALAPRFREVANVGEIRSGDSNSLSPLARIVSEYNERKRVDADTEKRLAEQRSRAEAEAEAEAIKKEVEEEEAEFEARAAKKEKEEAEAEARAAEARAAEAKLREYERREREREEARQRDYRAMTEAEREKRAMAEAEREKREAREDQELRRQERRDKAVDNATRRRLWDAVDNAKDLASWLEALERIDKQARADGGPGASASVLIDGLPLGLDALVFALSGENEEAVQATFDEVAIQNPQFVRVLRRAMVAQKGKVSAAMLASSLRRRATLAKQTGLALGPPEPVKQRVERAKARNIARNVAELATRMLAMRKEPQRGPQQEAKRNNVTIPEPSVKVRASKRGAAPKEKTDIILDADKQLEGNAVAFFYVGGDENEGDPESIALRKGDVPLKEVAKYLERRLGAGSNVQPHGSGLKCQATGYDGKAYSYTTPVRVEARKAASATGHVGPRAGRAGDRVEAERAEAEAERAEAARAERTERQRKQAEREREEQALDEQSGRDYAARTEAEHREQREHERKQREREREREREWADRERRENRELARRERRDKAADKATMSRAWAAVDNAKDLASWLEALERIDRQARADGGPGASASVLIDGLPLGLDVLVFALSGQNEEAVQATFDEVASQNPQFARALRRAMVAQRGKVSAAMLASSLRRRATLAKQTGLALGPPEPVNQGVKAPKRRNLARNVAELGLRMLAMRKEPQRGPTYLPDSAPGASSEQRTGRKARKKSEDMAKKKKSETTETTEKPAKPAKPKKEGRTGVSVRVGNLYRVIVGREMVDAEVIGRDEGGWILKRLPFVTAARAWEEGRQLRGRRSTEELKQCACVFDKENGA